MNINNNIDYRVAGHLFRVITNGFENVKENLPSFEPFYVDTNSEEAPVFTLSVNDWVKQEGGENVYTFDWEGGIFIFYKTEDGYRVDVSVESEEGSSYININTDFNQATVAFHGNCTCAEYILKNALMMMYTFSTADKKTVMIHSSIIRNNNYGYLFLGKSGTGKSTHSSLWLKHIEGSSLLNDDNPILRVANNKVYVFGSPWSGKTPCYINDFVEVGAFLKLEQAPQNIITKPSKILMFSELLSSISSMKWEKKIDDPICDTLVEITELCDLYHLKCLPDKAAAELSHSTISVGAKG